MVTCDKIFLLYMTLNIFTEGICPTQLWNVFAMQIILCNFFPPLLYWLKLFNSLMLKLCKYIFIIFHFRHGGGHRTTGTGSVYTHACIRIDGSIHKKIDRKLILAKILFPFYLLSFQPLKAQPWSQGAKPCTSTTFQHMLICECTRGPVDAGVI